LSVHLYKNKIGEEDGGKKKKREDPESISKEMGSGGGSVPRRSSVSENRVQPAGSKGAMD